jgi:hypothetical protein
MGNLHCTGQTLLAGPVFRHTDTDERYCPPYFSAEAFANGSSLRLQLTDGGPSPDTQPLMHALPEWLHDPETLLLRRLRRTPQLLEAIASTDCPEMTLQAKLRREFPDDLVRAALTLHELRRKAAAKFSRAADMWFDRQGLEQATSEIVAQHKARRFSGRVWDLCCGIGGDTLALAQRCQLVLAVDRQPAATLRASWNAAAYHVAQAVQPRVADAETLLPELTGELVHIDPDRRSGSATRALRLEDYVPGLDFLHRLQHTARGGGLKLGPASNFPGKFPDTEIELISHRGECKEAVVWFGELAGSSPFRATVLPAGDTICGHPLDTAAPLAPLDGYLFDPDPAVVRAGLVDVLAVQLDLRRLDAAEEYLTGPRLISSPFVQAFAVDAEVPNNERHIREAIRRLQWGIVEIKCRHVPVDADSLRRRLPLSGEAAGVLILARIAGRTRAVLAHRVSSSG